MKNRIDPHESLAAQVRRIAAGEIDRTKAGLDLARSRPESGFHEARKSLKRLRALFRLVRAADPPFWRAQNIHFRDIARDLSRVREAAALVETIARLTGTAAKDSAGKRLAAIEAVFVRHHDSIVGELTGRDSIVDKAVDAIEEGGRAIALCTLPDEPREAARILADGASKAVRRGKRALKRARRLGRQEDFHELRKAVKDHCRHLFLLESFWPKTMKSSRDRFESLDQRLGELNDLFVLRQVICDGEGGLTLEKEDIRLLQGLLRRDIRNQRRRCLSMAEKLFDLRPSRLGCMFCGRYLREARRGVVQSGSSASPISDR